MSETRGTSGLAIGAVASAAAAVLHAAASGIHADHVGLARIFIALAVAQLGAAVLAFVRSDRWASGSLLAVNAAALGGWLVTRLVGISWVGGLEVAERPQVADTIAALLAAVAVAAAGSYAVGRSATLPGRALSNSIILAAWPRRGTRPDRSTSRACRGRDGRAAGARRAARAPTPSRPPRFADVTTDRRARLPLDRRRGHRVRALHQPRATSRRAPARPDGPESLVYRVDGDDRTLVSAMFIATDGTAVDDPSWSTSADR
jgi:hypothetical protein